jgi:hypothetical protein
MSFRQPGKGWKTMLEEPNNQGHSSFIKSPDQFRDVTAK